MCIGKKPCSDPNSLFHSFFYKNCAYFHDFLYKKYTLKFTPFFRKKFAKNTVSTNKSRTYENKAKKCAFIAN